MAPRRVRKPKRIDDESEFPASDYQWEMLRFARTCMQATAAE